MLFSIVLPTFNRASFLKRAIESVVKQSYQNWELVIIDDGSTDNTRELVLNLSRAEHRIKYIYQENQERSAARNNGINNARGNFVCFLDSDDFYHEDHLMEFQKLILKHNSAEGMYFSGVSADAYDNTPMEYNLDHDSNVEFILLNSLGTPRACISKEILDLYSFNINIRIGEDIELWTRIAKKYPVFYHGRKTFIELDHDGRSIQGSCYDHLNTMKYVIKSLDKGAIRKKTINYIISNAYFNIAKYEILQARRFRAVLYLLKSIFNCTNHPQSMFKINLILYSVFRFSKIRNLTG